VSDDKINYNFYLLAFIDVLGQKEAFSDLGSQPLEVLPSVKTRNRQS